MTTLINAARCAAGPLCEHSDGKRGGYMPAGSEYVRADEGAMHVECWQRWHPKSVAGQGWSA